MEDSGPQSPTFRLATIVSDDLQQRLLTKYKEQVVPVFPLIPVPKDWNLETIRLRKPFLLEAIIYAVCHAEVSPNIQEEIARVFLGHLAENTISTGDKSLELLQAIHISCLWFCTHEQRKSVAGFQLLQVSLGMAIDIGIGGPRSTPWMGPLSEITESLEPADGWRAWLTCHMLSGVMTILLRRSKAEPWTEHHVTCLGMLEYSHEGSIYDRLLCQYVRAELLCEQIADDLNFVKLSTLYGVTDPSTQTKLHHWRNMIVDWQIQVPNELRRPNVMIYQHVITLYVNEPVLHTATNKASFAAPFIAECLSATDFPQPPVTLDHIIAINAIITNSHALLDLFTSMNLPTIVALPGMVFASRVAYTTYILVKLYIAVTAACNTYGTIIDPEILRIDHYVQKIVDVSLMFKKMNGPPSASWILASSIRMQEWLNSYKTMILSTQTLSSESFAQMPNVPLTTTVHEGWDDFMIIPDGQDFDLRDLFDIKEI